MLKTARQILNVVLLSCCIGFVFSLIPVPYQKYPINDCDNPDETYYKVEGFNGVTIALHRVVCFVHRNKEDSTAWANLAIATFTAVLSMFTISLAYSLTKRRCESRCRSPPNIFRVLKELTSSCLKISNLGDAPTRLTTLAISLRLNFPSKPRENPRRNCKS